MKTVYLNQEQQKKFEDIRFALSVKERKFYSTGKVMDYLLNVGKNALKGGKNE